MGLSIDLRTKEDTSYFRRHLLTIIDYPAVDKILLCSGYIQENLWYYSILDDELLNHLSNHPNFPNIELIIIAGKFNNYLWENAYKEFIRKIWRSGITTVSPYIAKQKNWHAKVVITLQGNRPLAAIIGSSNLTRPAFGEPYNRFNFECDVVIWSNDNVGRHISNSFSKDSVENNIEDPFSPIQAILNPEIKQLREDKRLYELYRLIMNEEKLIPYDEWKE